MSATGQEPQVRGGDRTFDALGPNLSVDLSVRVLPPPQGGLRHVAPRGLERASSAASVASDARKLDEAGGDVVLAVDASPVPPCLLALHLGIALPSGGRAASVGVGLGFEQRGEHSVLRLA